MTLRKITDRVNGLIVIGAWRRRRRKVQPKVRIFINGFEIGKW